MDWSRDGWNILHILAPLISKEDKSIFYEWIKEIRQVEWLEMNHVDSETDIIEWVYQFRKSIDIHCPKKSYLLSYYDTPSITRDVWGTYLWPFLHQLSYKVSSHLFQSSFTKVIQWLPCPVCRTHIKEYVSIHPFTEDMKTWMVFFHNDVTKRLNDTTGTKKKIYTLDEANDLYK